jgi:hypothetical protein
MGCEEGARVDSLDLDAKLAEGREARPGREQRIELGA